LLDSLLQEKAFIVMIALTSFNNLEESIDNGIIGDKSDINVIT